MTLHLQNILKRIPRNPGVYQFFDKSGNMLYIGKAKNLANRVRSYFREGATLQPDKEHMIEQIDDIQYTLVDSELEALLLETTLIKKHKPPFNIRMTDDKYWQYIKIQLSEDFPRIYPTREIKRDGAKYFGPYTSGLAVRDTLKLIRRIFLYRNCNLDITEDGIRRGTQKKFLKFGRPCLDYHIKKCVAPCAGKIAKQDYTKIIEQIIDFLEGKQTRILKSLEFQMQEASANHQYEKAARLRDQIHYIEQIIEKQKVISTTMKNQDIIAYVTHRTADEGEKAYVNLFMIRDGKLLDKKHVVMNVRDPNPEHKEQILHAFIKQYYSEASDIPDEILVQENVTESELLEEWLTQQKQSISSSRKKTRITTPRIGESKRLIDISIKNAQEFMTESLIASHKEDEKTTVALGKLGQALGLKSLPVRIECYDISNISGVDAVGSMVVFEYGKPAKQEYRRFAIKHTPGPNDFAMMREVLDRRFGRIADSTHITDDQHTQKTGFDHIPDLIILDGGKGQLSTIVKLFEERGITVPLASLAKKKEEIFLPHRSTSIMLPRGSQELYLVQRIRNEAHRFAITYFRKRHKTYIIASELDEIPGFGKETRKKLLTRFGSLKNIRAAQDDELATILTTSQLTNFREKFPTID